MLTPNHAGRDVNGGTEGHKPSANYCGVGAGAGSSDRLQVISCIDDGGITSAPRKVDNSDKSGEERNCVVVDNEDRQSVGENNETRTSGERLISVFELDTAWTTSGCQKAASTAIVISVGPMRWFGRSISR